MVDQMKLDCKGKIEFANYIENELEKVLKQHCLCDMLNTKEKNRILLRRVSSDELKTEEEWSKTKRLRRKVKNTMLDSNLSDF